MSEIDDFISKYSGLSENYSFYNNTVQLVYNIKEHIYYLVTEEGLEIVDGCSTICHIIDKSKILVPWGAKMMSLKLLNSLEPFFTNTDCIINKNILIDLVTKSKSAHKDVLEDAGSVGKIAHDWIEQYIKSTTANQPFLKDLPTEERAANCCMAALNWMNRHNVRWIFTERKVYSKQYKYAGTLDGLCLTDSCNDPKCCKEFYKDKLALSDWKTANGLHPEFRLQVSGYQHAFEEEFNILIEDAWVIRLGKTDGEFYVWHLDSREDYELGLDAFLDALMLSRSFKKVQEAVSEEQSVISNARKIAKKAARLEADKIQCKKFGTYKGVRYPTCNSGNPCQACLKKYNERHGTL